jgi:dTDP-glucose pyrophosphorylase
MAKAGLEHQGSFRVSLPVDILAGGLATRLRPINERVPKSLIDVAGRPFVAHQIELLRRHGLIDIVFLVGHLGEMIRDTLDVPGRFCEIGSPKGLEETRAYLAGKGVAAR